MNFTTLTIEKYGFLDTFLTCRKSGSLCRFRWCL